MQATLEARIKTLGEQIEEKDTQIKTIQDAAKTREAALTERVEALEKRVEEMAKAIAVKDNTIKALEGENNKLKIAAERHKAREGQWATDRQTMTEQINGLKVERDTLKARLDAQETRIEKLETSTGSIPIVKEDEGVTPNEDSSD
jgi:chromosome segregation ATPase